MRDPVVGDTLDRYRITDILARSGMASIFKAVDTVTGATVALKVPHIQYESDVVFSERFRREDEVLRRLDHPNVVHVLDAGERSRMYLVMEYVAGTSLRALMRAREPLPVPRALAIARQLASALEYLHDQGVIHRDIKPENLLVSEGDHVTLIDFGIALFASERRLTWQGFSNAVGTPDYMAPEQIRGRRGDPRTDVYAVGILLYEMLTCQLPWDTSNPRALLRAKATEEPRPPAYHVPGFDPSLEAIILKAIERDPRDRYANARQLLADLDNPSAVAARDPELGTARRRQRLRVRRRAVAAAAAAVVVGVLAGLVYLTHRLEAPPPRTPAGEHRR